MKKHIKLFSASLSGVRKLHVILFSGLILTAPLFSRAANARVTNSVAANGRPANGDDEVIKRKLINKSYNVTGNDKLDVENQFGNVMVSVWDKNEITVDIEIVAKASTDEKATAIMDEINVEDAQHGDLISFKTKVGVLDNKHGDHKHKDNQSFNIDYIIHLPAGNPLKLMNSFGKITVPDLRGTVDLTSKFGGLTAGKLSNVDAIDVEFGEASIGDISNGKLTLKFDKKADIGKLSGSVKLNIEFSDHVQFRVDDDISELSVFESYSNIRMIVTKALSADFEIHTSFGEFHNDSEFKVQEKKEGNNDEGPRFDKDYAGRSGEGKAKIKIKSSFGNIHLSHVANSTI
jgi:hypothetical protein